MNQPSSDAWNPDQYDRFREERRQPFFDLLGLVRPKAGMRVVDLGCGTGELTRVLHRRLAARETLGVDRSEAMLARTEVLAEPGLRFERGDIGEFAAEAAYDLVFSNAALQWLEDHEGLFARLTRALTPGGQLAVQMPANHDHPSHRVACELAAEPPFAALLGAEPPRPPVLAPESYASLLNRLGYAAQHVRLQIYGHLLGGRDEVVEWVKGTLLTSYAARLPEALFDAFLERYRERLRTEVADERPYFFPFKRILIWGARV